MHQVFIFNVFACHFLFYSLHRLELTQLTPSLFPSFPLSFFPSFLFTLFISSNLPFPLALLPCHFDFPIRCAGVACLRLRRARRLVRVSVKAAWLNCVKSMRSSSHQYMWQWNHMEGRAQLANFAMQMHIRRHSPLLLEAAQRARWCIDIDISTRHFHAYAYLGITQQTRLSCMV